MPITRVLDHDGRVEHDCVRSGCDVSWDGHALVDGLEVPNPKAGEPHEPDVLTLAHGDALPGVTKNDTSVRSIDATTVRRLPPAQ